MCMLRVNATQVDIKKKSQKVLRSGLANGMYIYAIDRWLPWPVAQLVKNLPAVQETRVRSLGQEDPMEEEMEIGRAHV